MSNNDATSSPLARSPFNKARSTRQFSTTNSKDSEMRANQQDNSFTSTLNPGSSQGSGLGLKVNLDRKYDKGEEIPMTKVQPSPPNSSKFKGPLVHQAILENALNPLQRLFTPASPTLLSTQPPPISNSASTRHHASFQVGNDDNEEINEDANQLTVQTMASDFEIPHHTKPKPYRQLPDLEPTPPPSLLRRVVGFLKKGRSEVNVTMLKRIVKSSISFFLSCLLVIIEPIREKLGPATFLAVILTVLFDCSRTIGAQFEIALLTIFFFIMALVYYCIAFGLFTLYNQSIQPYDPTTYGADGSFILVIFLMLAMFILGFLRAKFPKLTPSIVLTSVITIIAFAEVPFGSTHFAITFFGYALIPALIGVSISTIVNTILWPESASQDLGFSLELTLKDAETSLKFLTDCFLLEKNTLRASTPNLEQLHARSITAVTALIRAGKEARYEYAYSIHPPTDYKPLIKSALSLFQHLGGLNLAVQRQRELLALKKDDDDAISALSTPSGSLKEIKAFSLPPSPSALSLSKLGKDVIYTTSEIDPELSRRLIHDILHIVKYPLSQLSSTCQEALAAVMLALETENELEDTKGQIQDDSEIQECSCCHLKEFDLSNTCEHTKAEKQKNLKAMIVDLTKVIIQFELAEGQCLQLIHNQLLLTPHQHSPFPESMLIVFSGLFSLRQFATETVNFLGETEMFFNLRPAVKKRSGFLGTGKPKMFKEKMWWKPMVTWYSWLKANKASEQPDRSETDMPQNFDSLKQEAQDEINLNKDEEELESNLPHRDPNQLPTQHWKKPQYQARQTYNQLQPLTRFQKWRSALARGVWELFQHFNSFEVKFGFKLSLATMLLAFPAFIPSFATDFGHIKGTWGAISAMVIINQTIGATLNVGMVRVLGTVIGAIWGYLTYLASDDTKNLYVLVVMIWAFAAPCWYFIITSSYSRLGVTGLMTFSVILFSGYKQNTSADVLVFAALRALTVVVGLVVAMVVSSTIWPFSARRELRKLVAQLIADAGTNFGKVAALCMSPHETPEWSELDEQIRMAHRQMQKQILSAKTLLLFAIKEPRLKGPFPHALYSEQIRVLQDVLDQLVAMRGAASQLSADIQNTVIFPFNSYRKFMVSSVILYFYVLAGGLRTKEPLPPYPPPIHAVRYKLMLKTRAAMVRKLKRNNTPLVFALKHSIYEDQPINSKDQEEHNKKVREEFNHVYWYTYMAGLVRLFEDVELLGHNVATLVGETNIAIKEHVVNIDESVE